MHYRTHHGEHISEVGVGAYALSGAYGRKDPEQFVGMLRRAYELGVTLFDAADTYGPAEEILGRAVAPFRQHVWIATKVGASADGKPDCSADHLLSSCEASLRRLQTGYVDLYQVHFDDPHTPVEETIEALERLRAVGKIRRYGVGHLPLARLQEYFAEGDAFSALVELSAVARSARERAIPLCQAAQVAVIAFSVTGRGLLTGRIGPGHVFEEGDIRRIDPLFQRERLRSGLRVAGRFQALGKKYGKSPVQVAIAWVLAQSGVVCALTGPSTIPHLEENLGGSGWTIAPDDLAELERFLQKEDRRLYQEQTRSTRSILRQELDDKKAFADLVYALETLAELGAATEEQALPFLQQLLALRGKDDATALAQMRSIQAELRKRFLSKLPALTSGNSGPRNRPASG